MSELQYWQEHSCGPSVALEMLRLLQAHGVTGYQLDLRYRQPASAYAPLSAIAYLTLHRPIPLRLLSDMRKDAHSIQCPGTRTHTLGLLGTLRACMRELAQETAE